VALVVGYDRHPAGRAALRFAGELAGALNVPLHVVHVIDVGDDASSGATDSTDAGDGAAAEPEHLGDAFDAAHVQWSYDRLTGDPATVLLDAANQRSAAMLILGRPEQGLGAAVGHIITGNIARNVLRRSTRPVVIVPEFGAAPR
jgi:nucleotide-binding universal stress UspA family protein